MGKIFLLQKLDVNKFLDGQNPEFPFGHLYKGAGTTAAMQIGCVLSGQDRFQGTVALVCNGKESDNSEFCLPRYDEGMLTGVMLHVFDTHTGASRVFIADAQNETIDWDALRACTQGYTEFPFDTQNVQRANGIDECQIDMPMHLTYSAMLSVVNHQPDWDSKTASEYATAVHKAFEQSKEMTEYGRMVDALATALKAMGNKAAAVNLGEILQEHAASITSPQERAHWEFSQCSDTTAAMLRTHWNGYYEMTQREGYPPEMAAVIATLKTAQGGLDETRNTDRGAFHLSAFDVQQCTAIRDSAAQQAIQQGVPAFNVGTIRHSHFAKYEATRLTDVGDLVAFIANYAYSEQLPGKLEPFGKTIKLPNTTATVDERFAVALEQANQQMMKLGVAPSQLPTVETMQKAMTELVAANFDPKSYFALHAGGLPPYITDLCQEKYLHQVICEGALHDIKNAAVCATALHKVAKEMCADVIPGSPAYTTLEKLQATTFKEMQEAEQQHSDTRDDIGDDTVGEDSK